MMSMIGITLGDLTGIGPEVALKALAADTSATKFLLIGDEAHTRRLNEQLGLKLPLHMYAGKDHEGRFFIHNPTSTLPANLPTGSPEAARAAVAYLQDSGERCLRGELQAVVTAPVNKETIIRAGHDTFVGQTEFFSDLAGAKRTAMMLLGHDDRGRWLRVVLATTHVPIKLVAERLTQAKIELAIELAAKSCRDLALPRARVGVCGLNPHAGEGGKMGTEEIAVVGPACEAMRARSLDVTGPIAADTLFHRAFHGEFDVVVAMYHDQGLAPLKMIAFDSGVNWTLGLPFVRTSPDHGTAYDIAGQNKANPSSMIAAINLAKQLVTKL